MSLSMRKARTPVGFGSCHFPSGSVAAVGVEGEGSEESSVVCCHDADVEVVDEHDHGLVFVCAADARRGASGLRWPERDGPGLVDAVMADPVVRSGVRSRPARSWQLPGLGDSGGGPVEGPVGAPLVEFVGELRRASPGVRRWWRAGVFGRPTISSSSGGTARLWRHFRDERGRLV